MRMKELRVSERKDVYKHLAEVLPEYCEKPMFSEIFIVEGMLEKPRVGIRYPGKKLRKRNVSPRFAQWANLLDFLVVPFVNGVEQLPKEFNYRYILADFDEHKKDSDAFWEMIVELYEKGVITKEPPNLGGLEPKLFLEMLKWLMIQEDLNYKLSCEDTECKVKYVLTNKNGRPTRKGAGRAKFFAALLLVRDKHFDSKIVSKIIP